MLVDHFHNVGTLIDHYSTLWLKQCKKRKCQANAHDALDFLAISTYTQSLRDFPVHICKTFQFPTLTLCSNWWLWDSEKNINHKITHISHHKNVSLWPWNNCCDDQYEFFKDGLHIEPPSRLSCNGRNVAKTHYQTTNWILLCVVRTMQFVVW